MNPSGDLHILFVSGETWAELVKAGAKYGMQPETMVSVALSEYLERMANPPKAEKPPVPAKAKVERIR